MPIIRPDPIYLIPHHTAEVVDGAPFLDTTSRTALDVFWALGGSKPVYGQFDEDTHIASQELLIPGTVEFEARHSHVARVAIPVDTMDDEHFVLYRVTAHAFVQGRDADSSTSQEQHAYNVRLMYCPLPAGVVDGSDIARFSTFYTTDAAAVAQHKEFFVARFSSATGPNYSFQSPPIWRQQFAVRPTDLLPSISHLGFALCLTNVHDQTDIGLYWRLFLQVESYTTQLPVTSPYR